MFNPLAIDTKNTYNIRYYLKLCCVRNATAIIYVWKNCKAIKYNIDIETHIAIKLLRLYTPILWNHYLLTNKTFNYKLLLKQEYCRHFAS